ncbi:response regulator [Streptomyces sp. NPDC091215]|uniref:response regulator n=1 Tax=Streptomyces sp. NPDC091215 TaxID=3155192 RepID=UPI0034365D28
MAGPVEVVIIEDDPVITHVYDKMIKVIPQFAVVGTARTASSGLVTIAKLSPHLVLLDYGLPGGASGVDLLRRIRAEGHRAEVIAITAHSSTDLVRESMRLGVIDYLVKPFPEERFRQALAKAVGILATVRSAALAQRDVDQLRESIAPVKQYVPAELSAVRLDEVRQVLTAAAAPISAEEVAVRIASSRVTARRYLEFLVSLNEVDIDLATDRPGRPRKLYSLRPKVGVR